MADPTKTSTDSTPAAKADAAASSKTQDAAASTTGAAAAGGPTGLDAAAGGGPTAATRASQAQTRGTQARASAKASHAGAKAASEDQDEDKAPERSKPTSEGSFGHTQVGKTPLSPAPAEDVEPAQIPKADINSDDDLEDDIHPDDRRAAVTMHQPEVKSPINHPPYDVQKVFGTANQSVLQDESGRWKIQFPESVDTSAFDKKDANVNPSTTFATRELAYKAAVKLLKTSPSMNRPAAARGR